MNRAILKWIGILTMTIDHIGLYLVEDSSWNLAFRLIGRFAFPIFAFLIAEGFLKSKHLKQYWIRLFSFTVLVEVLFFLYGLWTDDIALFKSNVFIVLLLGLSLLMVLKSSVEWHHLLAIPILVFSAIVQYPYTVYGLLLILIFGFVQKTWMKALLFVLIHLLLIQIPSVNDSLYLYPWQQQFALLFIPLMFLYNGKKTKENKWFFYWYYPIHMIVIIGVSHLIK